MVLDQFRAALNAIGQEATPLEIAEILWLAQHVVTSSSPEALQATTGVPGPSLAQGARAPQRPEPEAAPVGTATQIPERHQLHAYVGPDAGGKPGRGILAPTSPMLRNVMGIQRALRPLKRRTPSPRLSVVDEQATAESIARQAGRHPWQPVMRPEPERWLSLALVIDTAPSMHMWQPLAHELRQALLTTGAFRDLRIWYLTSGPGKVAVFPTPAGRRPQGPKALADPSRRQVVLILSDCSGPAWWDGRAAEAVLPWARNGPVAILQPLPERLWGRSAAPAIPGLATMTRPCAPNTTLNFTPVNGSTSRPQDSIPVPVLEVAPEWASSWARLVTATAGQGLPAAVTYLTSQTRQTPSPPRLEQQLPIEERVRRFRIASPEAATLAAYTAVSTPALPVMRLIQQILLPATGPGHLAEVILSGMLRPVGDAPGLYDFVPGAREALLATLPRSESWHTTDILNQMSKGIEQMAGKAARSFRAYAPASDNTSEYDLTIAGQPFALVSAEALTTLRNTAISAPSPSTTIIPSHARNAIVGRFLGLQALAPNLSTIASHGHQDTADRLIQRLCWITNEMLDDPDSRQTLGEFLRGLVSGLNDEVRSFSGASRSAVQPALEELGALVAGYEAAPYDPLERMADAAARTAADYYRAFDAEVPDELWQSTFLRSSFVNGNIGMSFDSTIHLQHWTEFGVDNYPAAQVIVKISPRWLDQETIATLPRSLLHEYVAHVPQGPYLGRRAHPDAGDMFAEGWMDYIAHLIFKAVTERRGPSLALGDSLASSWVTFHEDAAERYFSARFALADGNPTAAARREGVHAARQLHDLLRRLTVTKDRADEHLYRLSLGLNVSRFGNVARERFAANVRLSLQRASRVDALTVPLIEWASGHISSEDFFERVIDN